MLISWSSEFDTRDGVMKLEAVTSSQLNNSGYKVLIISELIKS